MRHWYEDWKRLNPILAEGEVGEIIGMVDTKTGDGKTPWVDLPFTSVSSDGIPGVPMIRKFPFAFDTPGLLTGHVVYTPTVDDILLDAWIEVTEAWDGATPQGDAGIFENNYWFGKAGYGAIDFSVADNTTSALPGLLAQATAAAQPASALVNLEIHSYEGLAGGRRGVPGKFVTTDPVKVVVSTDGTDAGSDPGSTQGVAVLYLVTVTPTA